MAIKGLEGFNKENPPFELDDFLKIIPKFKTFLENPEYLAMFEFYKETADGITSSEYYGKAWKLAMSYTIAHYLTLFATEVSDYDNGTASDLASSASPQGIITGYSVGGLSQSMDFDMINVDDKDAKFWNRTEYGSKLMALRATIFTPLMFIGTPGIF